jgi:hypothetical protein
MVDGRAPSHGTLPARMSRPSRLTSERRDTCGGSRGHGMRQQPCATTHAERPMYLIRDIMYCKPGQVRPMVEKFIAMSKLTEKLGMPRMRVMTDFSAEQYWTAVSEMEVPDLQSFEQMMTSPPGSEEDMKQFEEVMKGYHDLVDHGKREIYKIES